MYNEFDNLAKLDNSQNYAAEYGINAAKLQHERV